jgi:NADP-dependent 3-hydroxy acid dehydrogenase YdfG
MTPLVFITGASSGIGQALALRYHQAGYRLALVARRTDEVKSWAEANGVDDDRYKIYSADVSLPDSIIEAGQACMQLQGIPEVVIANAGISLGVDTAIREDIAVMAHILATNSVGVAATFHPFITAMTARGHGKLVGMASVAGIRGLPGHGA